MKAYLSRRYRISASHRLHSGAFSDEKNSAVYGKCNNPYGHGHNYVIQVTVSGQVDPKTGMVCDLGALDGCVRSEVIERFDHANLNCDEYFFTRVPTTENLCRTIFGLLAGRFSAARPEDARLPPARLERVRIEETANNFFEYAGKE